MQRIPRLEEKEEQHLPHRYPRDPLPFMSSREPARYAVHLARCCWPPNEIAGLCIRPLRVCCRDGDAFLSPLDLLAILSGDGPWMPLCAIPA